MGVLVAPAVAVPALIGALVLFVQPVPSEAAPDELYGSDEARAVELLNRSATATSRVSYQGTQYVSAWSALTKSGASASAVVQVRHRAGGPTEIGVQDTQTAILQGNSGTSWLAEDGGSVDLLVRSYDVRVTGEGQVASRMADVVEARRGDGSIAARWWLDQQTALPLRREAFMPDGRLLSASAFVDISLVPTPPCCLRSSIAPATTPAVTEDHAALHWDDIEKLRAEGFHCLESLGEDVVLYEARELGDAIHLSYSDGVMTVSVFEQPGRLDPEQLDGYTQSPVGDGVVYMSPGPPARFTWQSSGRVITVVADAPLELIDEIVSAMPPDGPVAEEDGGFLARIARGAGKVGTWVNPFD
nr:sigma-E factor regulatory protein RseB domain-containing protein [Phytoactinopolyspora alkaliphila]